jgi:hypothetical protein
MSKPMLLAQVIPTSGPLHAVLVNDDGTPAFLPVVCIGVLEHPEHPVRVVAGMIADGQHIEPADRLAKHVGYTHCPNPEAWAERCQAKLAEIRAAEEAAKQNRIVLPEGKVVRPWN